MESTLRSDAYVAMHMATLVVIGGLMSLFGGFLVACLLIIVGLFATDAATCKEEKWKHIEVCLIYHGVPLALQVIGALTVLWTSMAGIAFLMRRGLKKM